MTFPKAIRAEPGRSWDQRELHEVDTTSGACCDGPKLISFSASSLEWHLASTPRRTRMQSQPPQRFAGHRRFEPDPALISLSHACVERILVGRAPRLDERRFRECRLDQDLVRVLARAGERGRCATPAAAPPSSRADLLRRRPPRLPPVRHPRKIQQSPADAPGLCKGHHRL